MKHFKVGVLDYWNQYNLGSILSFPSNRPRRVKFEVVANSPIEIWVDKESGDLSKAILIASGDDKMSIEYTATTDSWVLIKADKKAQVWVNLPDLNQRVSKTVDEEFVNLEPRIRENKEFNQLVKVMNMNRASFEAAMAGERQQLRELRQKVAEMQKEEAEVIEEPVEDDKSSTSDT